MLDYAIWRMKNDFEIKQLSHVALYRVLNNIFSNLVSVLFALIVLFRVFGSYYQSCNESTFSRVRVKSESCMSRVKSESESYWAGLESKSESSRSRVRVRVRVRVQVFVAWVRIRVPRSGNFSTLAQGIFHNTINNYNIIVIPLKV